jgi:Aegerolysin
MLVMAARSVYIDIVNLAGSWNRSNAGLSHGAWGDNEGFVPPEIIVRPTVDDDGNVSPGTAAFESESDGFMTGVQGFVEYVKKGTDGTLRIDWDNPYLGANSFSVTAPEGVRATYEQHGGNDVSYHILISKA